jgi:benzodiazapine receptor
LKKEIVNMNESNANQNGQMVEKIVNQVMGVKTTPEGERLAQRTIENTTLDWGMLLNYKLGTLLQIGILVSALWGMNELSNLIIDSSLPNWSNTLMAVLFFTLLSIRSRLFSPLDNTRSRKTYNEVIRPKWAPPPLAFPIVWMAIAVLRVTSSVLVWQELNYNFLSLPLIAFVIHLALGDTWNTIFSVQGRLGAAVPVVILGPWLSVIIVTAIYWLVKPLAGLILFPSCLWLTVATILVISIWRLNGSEPLYPVKLANNV